MNPETVTPNTETAFILNDDEQDIVASGVSIYMALAMIAEKPDDYDAAIPLAERLGISPLGVLNIAFKLREYLS